jgi:hypothetical protein
MGRRAVLSEAGIQDDGIRDGTALARQRVEREAEARTGTLTLACLGLDALPDGLRELTALRELDLSGNILAQLPVWVGRLDALETLLLRGNRLSALPESLTALTRLKRIDLADNNFAEIPRWLGRLDLEAIEFGDADALVHPPASVIAEGTPAVLAYLRKRDMQTGGPLVTRRASGLSIPRPRTVPDAVSLTRTTAAQRASSLFDSRPAAPTGGPAGTSVADVEAAGPLGPGSRPRPRPKVLIIAAGVAILAVAGVSAAVLRSGDNHPAASSAPTLDATAANGNAALNSYAGSPATLSGTLAPTVPAGSSSAALGNPAASVPASASASGAVSPKSVACPAPLTITSPIRGTKITGRTGATLDITACGLTSGQSGWLFDLDTGDGTYGLDGSGPIVTGNGTSTFTDAPIGAHGDVNEGVKLTLVLADSACSTALRGMGLQNTYPTALPSSCQIASQVLVIETY